jgi:hypothetical protein
MEPSRGKSICIPFKSEDHYASCVADPEGFRQYLLDLHSRHPELLPAGFEHGFVFHDKSWSIKQRVLTRRLRLIATGQLYQVRPSFLMPYLTARTEMVERGLYLRQWGVPFDALAYLFGGDAMFWYRAEVTLGRPSLVGTTLPSRGAVILMSNSRYYSYTSCPPSPPCAGCRRQCKTRVACRRRRRASHGCSLRNAGAESRGPVCRKSSN